MTNKVMTTIEDRILQARIKIAQRKQIAARLKQWDRFYGRRLN